MVYQDNRLITLNSKDAEKKIQDSTDKYIALIEKLLVAKEKEIMSV